MKTVVMTGGTSGLGEFAARQIAGTPDTLLLLGARGDGARGIETLPLDLARLADVRAFAGAVADRLGGAPIDVLVLNAATQFVALDQRTVDGFETTFAVNHLAHYLLLRLLLPKMVQDAAVVITTSNTHDAASNPLAPKELNVEQWAHPPDQPELQGPKPGFRAYATSKLCNLLTARAIAQTAEGRARGIRAIAYNPGLTPDTSLFRDWPLETRVEMRAKVRSPGSLLTTVPIAGQALADLAMGRIAPPPGRLYGSIVERKLTWPEPAELVRNDEAVKILWRESAALVGLPNSF